MKTQPVFKRSGILMILLLIAASVWIMGAVNATPATETVPDANNGDGPGGVGATNGSSSLELWLNAGAGTFSDTGCTNPQITNGGVVSCWQDQSGNGNDVSRVIGPQYRNNAAESLNGQPVLDFMGTAYLERDITYADVDFTIFAVAVPSASMAEWDSIFSTHHSPYIPNSFQLDVGGSRDGCTGQFGLFVNDNDAAIRLCNSNYNAGPKILTYRWDSAAVSTWHNGSLGNSYSSATFNPGFDLFKIGVNRGDNQPWPNDIAEEIVFWMGLPGVERLLVENYLQAKYNDSTVNNLTIANDVYDGDMTINGDFDLNVAGIGQAGGVQHSQTHAAGMIIVDNTFLQDDGDWLLFGHNTVANDNTTADVPTSGDWDGINDLRWVRSFYIDVTDAIANGGTVNIIFDFSEGGMDNNGTVPAGNVNNYRLLKRSSANGPFSDIATATAIAGDQVQFLNVDVSLLDSNFTLGTIDAPSSPVAIKLQSIEAQKNVGTNDFLLYALLGVLGLLVLAALILWRSTPRG